MTLTNDDTNTNSIEEISSKKEPFNFKRKLWHLIGLFVPFLYYFDTLSSWKGFVHPTQAYGVIIISGALVLVSLVEIVRFNSKIAKELFNKYFGFILKKKEQKKMNATVPFLLSNVIVITFFPMEIAIGTIFFLLFGDTAAAYFGGKYGKFRFYNGKSFIGILGAIIGGFIAVSVFMLLHSYYHTAKEGIFYFNESGILGSVVLIFFLGSLFAAIAEFFSGDHFMGFLDDNLTIPVVSGFFMTIIYALVNNEPIFSKFFTLAEVFR